MMIAKSLLTSSSERAAVGSSMMIMFAWAAIALAISSAFLSPMVRLPLSSWAFSPNPTIFNTPNEMPEEEIEAGLRPIMERGMALVVHCPPLGVLDLTSVNRHAGSVAIAKLIREFQPKVVLSGHIHEARGIVERDGILHMNPGPAKDGYSGIIELGTEARATLLERSPEE